MATPPLYQTTRVVPLCDFALPVGPHVIQFYAGRPEMVEPHVLAALKAGGWPVKEE